MTTLDPTVAAAIRTVLGFYRSHPWTGLADAPLPVRRALDVLDRAAPAPRHKAPAPAKRKAPPSSPVPSWAVDLIRQVCADEGRAAPKVTWYCRSEQWSSGLTCKDEGRIHVTAGTDLDEARHTVLHELAHWLGRRDWAHTRRFWELAWRLYGEYLTDDELPAVLEREAACFAKARVYCPAGVLERCAP